MGHDAKASYSMTKTSKLFIYFDVYFIVMKNNMIDTIRIDAKNVDRTVGEAFKSFVLKKHGKLRGAYSEEVTMALAMYLREAKKLKDGEKTREQERSNIASWGDIFGSMNMSLERVYLEVEQMLKNNGLIFSPLTGRIAFVDNTTATCVKQTIRSFLREERYFDMLCQRYGLLVLEDDSVMETSTLKE